MTCAEFKTVLIDHLDGRLAPDLGAAAEAHLETCAACRRDAELHRRTWELAGKIESVEPASDFAASVHRRVHRSRILAILGSCAAAAAIVIAVLFARGPEGTPPAVTDAVRRLDPEDRTLLEELARDRTWELADNIDLARAFELLESPQAEEDH